MRLRLILIIGFVALTSSANLFGSGSIKLQRYEVIEGIHFPFPHEPESLGEMRSEDFLERGWRADKSNIGFTATVMIEAPEIPTGFDEHAILFNYSSNIARSMGGEILSRETKTISGFPALIMRTKLDQFPVEGRSKTLLIYQHGKLHT